MITEVNNKLSKNVILVDASYVDKVAFDLTVNFERMLMRRIPKADLAHWLDCIALDGGLQPGENDIQVIFIYKKGVNGLSNFTPSQFGNDIHSKAFKDNIGEFTMYAFPVEENVTTTEFFFLDTLALILDNENVENVMVLPDIEKYGGEVRGQLKKNKNKQVTLFAMEPQMGTGFNQQILGYSLMSALGISGDEL
ncbi:MAG: hypothetical protein K6E54_05695 [Bacteroidaceae bacterium]|nr:hypothetical protein [Bacteroidaceae bacterium]